MSVVELLKFIGIMVLMTRYEFGNRESIWMQPMFIPQSASVQMNQSPSGMVWVENGLLIKVELTHLCFKLLDKPRKSQVVKTA